MESTELEVLRSQRDTFEIEARAWEESYHAQVQITKQAKQDAVAVFRAYTNRDSVSGDLMRRIGNYDRERGTEVRNV